jgi:hypothetical protein
MFSATNTPNLVKPRLPKKPSRVSL